MTSLESAAHKPSASPALRWPSTSLSGTLEPGCIYLWAWRFRAEGELDAEDLRLLDDNERQRTARFKFLPDRLRYSICHANMRRILGSYLSRPPEAIAYRDGPGGKPELQHEANDLAVHFNLSHSKRIAVLAVALGIEIGVDVEDVHPIEQAVAERFFSVAERKAMADLTGPDWLDAFYRCWTRKEAILKAEGVGLRIELASFDVSVRMQEPAVLLAARPAARLTADWTLHHLTPAAGAIGALAVNDAAAKVVASAFQR